MKRVVCLFFFLSCPTFSNEPVKLEKSCHVEICLRVWHGGDPDSLCKKTPSTPPVNVVSSLLSKSCQLPFKWAKSCSLWNWSKTRDMFFVVSQVASWSPALTSIVRALIEATTSNTAIVDIAPLIIIFKNFIILFLFPESVIVTDCPDDALRAAG